MDTKTLHFLFGWAKNILPTKCHCWQLLAQRMVAMCFDYLMMHSAIKPGLL